MLVSLLPVPFADAARQRQYEALCTALAADAEAPATVLLGNLGAFTPITVDALIVRPNGLALIVLTPRPGHLTMPALTYGTWQLNGQALPGRAGADNPFAQFQQQMPAALAWLTEQLGRPEQSLPLPCLGIAVFEAPLTFGPEVEGQLHYHSAAHDFQLLGAAAQVPLRLRQQAGASPDILAADELLDWAEYLATEQPIFEEPEVALATDFSVSSFLEQKFRQLWRWLGAEDIPADPPYGGPAPTDTTQRDQQEQARLQQLRHELQAELHQQRQEAATREATRTQELASLRQQLAQAGQPAAQGQAEQRAQAALEESLRITRAELTARTQELDARIQFLGQLIGQMQLAPVMPVVVQPTETAAPASSAPAMPRPAPAARSQSVRRLRQAERWAMALLALAITSTGTVAVLRALRPAPTRPAATAALRASDNSSPLSNEDQVPAIVYDTLAAAPPPSRDTAASKAAAPAAEPPQASPAAPAATDSAASMASPAPLPPAADSMPLGASPKP